ncbi:acyltransferase family protein [Corynebacterium sp.]|uniref:acyltransferase family protein n=1 Tax=Corynebacterium sp. TaxID=1720 RepID=UPI003736E37D
MSTTTAPRSSTYRPELDGLRGIAIGLVVLFHVFVGRVSGGVDVFLLLSGYFFLGSQLRYAARRNASLNPWWPLWRTVRRLFPALAVVLVATVGLAWWLTPQLITPELTAQLNASLLYYLNWELIDQQAAYAAASADTSPLQHLWSMSVQGQFYLFAIVFALFFAWLVSRRGWNSHRVRRLAGPILILLTVLSFAWACRHGFVGTPASYYSTFSRLWELTLGAVLVLYLPYLNLPRRLAGPATGLGLALIAVTGLIIPTSLAFPGPAALIPISGAVLIIAGGGHGRTAKLMASKPAIWLGDVAYSLYLWHWPLLIILTTATGNETPPFWLGVLVVAFSLVLADVTHRFVETPLRQHRRRPTAEETPAQAAVESLRRAPGQRRAVGGVLVAGLVAGLLSVGPFYAGHLGRIDDQDLDPAVYPGARVVAGVDAPDGVAPRPDLSLVSNIFPAPAGDGCLIYNDEPHDRYATENIDGDPCVYGDPAAEQTIVLAGGSHAETWIVPLDELGQTFGFRVIPFLRQSCPTVLGENFGVDADCAAWNEGAVAQIIDLDPEAVVSTSTRPLHWDGVGPDAVPLGYEAFWRVLDEHQIPFIGLRDNPWIVTPADEAEDMNQCLLQHQAGGDAFFPHEDPILACSVPREHVYSPVDPAAAVLEQYPNAVAVDTADWFCAADTCPPIIGNIPVYRDKDHISNAYASSMRGLVWDYLGPVLGR